MPETSILVKAKNLTKAAFDEIQKSLDITASYFSKLAKGATQAEKGMTGSLNRVKNALQENKEGFQAITLGMGAVAASSGLLAKSFLDAATRMETMKIALTATVGSSAEAERQLVRLREVAKLPGLGFPEAVQGSVNLQQVGFSAEMAERLLKGVGNALVLVGKGRTELEGVTTAFVQMHTKGKVLAEEINQIAERMPQIRKAMLAAFGTADTEVIQKMGLTTQQFISGVMAELEKLPKATGGAANAVENLVDAWFQLRASVGENLLPAFTKLINTLASIVEWFNKLSGTAKAIIGWGTALTAGIAALGTAFGGLVLALPGIIAGFTTLSAIIPTLSASLAAFAVGPGGIVLASVASFVALHFALKQLSNTIVELIEQQTVFATAMKDFGTLTDVEVTRKMANAAKIIEQYDNQLLKLQEDEKKNVAVIDDVVKKRDELVKIYQDLQNVQKQRQVKKEAGGELDLKLRQRELELIEDRYEKEREQARLTAEEKITTYQKEIKDSEQLNKAIAIERQILAKTLTAIDNEAAKERAKIAEQEWKDRNTALRRMVESAKAATDAETAYYAAMQAEVRAKTVEALREKAKADAEVRAKALEETDFQIRLAEGFQAVMEKTDAEMAQSAVNYLAKQETFAEDNAKTKALIEKSTTDIAVQEYQRRMAEHDYMTAKMLENSEVEVQAFYQAVQENKKMSEDLERNIESFSSRAADLLVEIPFRLGEAFITGKGSVEGIIKDFFSGIAQLILQEAQRIIAMQIAAKITASLLPAAGGQGAGGLAAGLGAVLPFLGPAAPYVGIGLAAYQLFKGGFDSPVNDRLAQRVGQQTALVYGASFDNPVNDYRARLQGTMAASQAMGERSAADMVTNFQRGFTQKIPPPPLRKGGIANENTTPLPGGTDDDFKEILTKLERRLGETPQLRVYLGDREITSVVRREIDKQNSRRMAY